MGTWQFFYAVMSCIFVGRYRRPRSTANSTRRLDGCIWTLITNMRANLVFPTVLVEYAVAFRSPNVRAMREVFQTDMANSEVALINGGCFRCRSGPLLPGQRRVILEKVGWRWTARCHACLWLAGCLCRRRWCCVSFASPSKMPPVDPRFLAPPHDRRLGVVNVGDAAG